MTLGKTVLDQESKDQPRLVLDQLVCEGAREMLQRALDVEVSEFLDRHPGERDSQGHRQLVRYGTLPERNSLTEVWPLPRRQPRVRDRRGASSEEAGWLRLH